MKYLKLTILFLTISVFSVLLVFGFLRKEESNQISVNKVDTDYYNIAIHDENVKINFINIASSSLKNKTAQKSD